MMKSGVQKIFRERTGFKLLIFLIWMAAVVYAVSPLVETHQFATLHKIKKAGEITVITRNTAHCYFTYRDQAMGFEYDLARAFAEYLGVRLTLHIADSWEGMIPALKNGSGAVIAASMTIPADRENQVAFSDGYMQIQQHIIARRGNEIAKRAEDLSGKTVHVRKGTSYQEKLEALNRRGMDIDIQLHKDVPTEELIQKLAQGEFDITIADSHIAMLNQRHYPRAVMLGPISGKQMLGWAVHPRSHELLNEVNSFFRTIKDNGRYAEIYNKYYKDVDEFDYVDLRTFHQRIKTRLPRYSPFIKDASRKHGFDWRLIAAQMYQESHLQPWAQSNAGAAGLMQLLPRTARSLGVDDIFNPVQNINAGVGHLKSLYDYFDKAPGKDRLLISLAAYNVGLGHVIDARKLAVKKGLNPDQWASLAQTLPLLKYRQYYKNSRHGYCRGDEPVAYIKQILIYYDILKRQGADYKAARVDLGRR